MPSWRGILHQDMPAVLYSARDGLPVWVPLSVAQKLGSYVFISTVFSPHEFVSHNPSPPCVGVYISSGQAVHNVHAEFASHNVHGDLPFRFPHSDFRSPVSLSELYNT